MEAQAPMAGLLADEHRGVAGARIAARASHESFGAKEGSVGPSGTGGIMGWGRCPRAAQRRLHAATTDPQVRRYKGRRGASAKQVCLEQVVRVNRCELIGAAHGARLKDTTEHIAAVSMIRWIGGVAADCSAKAERKTRVKALSDKIDNSDIPAAWRMFWSVAAPGRVHKPIEQSTTIRGDADVLGWLRSQGKRATRRGSMPC